MRTQCRDCGHPTHKGLQVCSYCARRRPRPDRRCAECGSARDVRKDRGASSTLRCTPCRRKAQVRRALELAGPIVAEGGGLARLGRAMGISGERARQVLAALPGPAPDLRRAHREVLAERLENLLRQGGLAREAGRACGLSREMLRRLLKEHPDLGRLAQANRREARRRRFDPVFQLVEREGLSLRAACLRLGLPCRMALYEAARSPGARERFPVLRNFRGRPRQGEAVLPAAS